MKFYIVTYQHRHGTDAWPVWQTSEPDLEEIQEELTQAGTFEPDRDDESLDSYGPFEVPLEGFVKRFEAEVATKDKTRNDMFHLGMEAGIARAVNILKIKGNP